MKKKLKKIKAFFKKRKKIFKPILYTLGGIGSIVGVWLLAIIISIGGVTNFVERAKFEIIVWNIDKSFGSFSYEENCQSPAIFKNFGPIWSSYLFKEETQFLDYFDKTDKYLTDKGRKKARSFLPFIKGDPEIQIQIALRLKDDGLLNFNHCKATKLFLKAAHQNNKTAQMILAAYPENIRLFYQSEILTNNKYLFSRYIKKIKEKDLKNPALAYAYALHLDEKIDRFSYEKEEINFKPEALNYLKQSSDEGYIQATIDLLSIYTRDEFFEMSNCEMITKKNNFLAEKGSILNLAIKFSSSMGRLYSYLPKALYKCSGNKPNFSRAFTLAEKISSDIYAFNKINIFNSFYPALFYLNGWEDKKQDYKKAYELFSKQDDSERSLMYLSYMNFKGLGIPKNAKKGLDFAIKLINERYVTDYKNSSTAIICEKKMYEFEIPSVKDETEDETTKRESRYKDEIISCLKKADEKVNLKTIEDYIKLNMKDWFNNPELFKTLNYLGEPK